MTISLEYTPDFLLPTSIITKDYTISPRDNGDELRFQSSGTVTCTLAPTLDFDNGMSVLVRNAGSANVTIVAFLGNLIDGSASLILPPGEFRWLQTDGQDWSSIAQFIDQSSISDLVKVSASDTTAGYLDAKIAAGIGLNSAIAGAGMDEDLSLNVDVGTGPNQIVQLDSASRLPAVDGSQLTGINDADENVKVSANDTQAGYLGAKIAAGVGLNSAISGAGADEDLSLSVDVGTGPNQIVQLDGSSRLPVVDGSQLTGVLKKDVTETVEVGYTTLVHAIGNSGAATVTPVLANGAIQTMTVNGSFTLAAPTDVNSGRAVIETTNDATGGYSPNFSAYTTLSGSYVATANAVNLIEITKVGSNLYISFTEVV